jgi:hypothetical protein
MTADARTHNGDGSAILSRKMAEHMPFCVHGRFHPAGLRPGDFRGLRSFGEDYPTSRRYLLYRGEARFERDGVLCMPCEEFLLDLQPGRIPS